MRREAGARKKITRRKCKATLMQSCCANSKAKGISHYVALS